MASELLPCPFCGGTDLSSGGDDKFVGYFCKTCQATGPNHYGSRDWNTRPAPAATDTGLVTVAWQHQDYDEWHETRVPEYHKNRGKNVRELVTRSQAEAIIRDLETKILDAAISDRLDDAGAPLSWQERAEIAEGIISDLKADNAAKDARIKELDRCHEGTIDLCNQKTAQIEALEAKLAAAEQFIQFCADGFFVTDDELRGAARAVLGGKP